jgi:hypothetical protein
VPGFVKSKGSSPRKIRSPPDADGTGEDLRSITCLFAWRLLCYKKNFGHTKCLFEKLSATEPDMQRGKHEPIEIVCPRCRYKEIVYLPLEDLPLCPECNTQMLISELLDEGKSY